MEMREEESLELSIVMPCLNEESTVGVCVEEAMMFLQNNHIEGEVLVIDNGCTDDSAAIAKKNGAKIVKEFQKGYGRAIRTGIENSKGKIIIIGDCDMTYDFLHLEEMYQMLTEGQCDMMIGNRYAGGIEKGGMSWLHRWGVRVLSCLARKRFKTDVYDFHCGLRGMTRKCAKQLAFCTEGMEFATEMIAVAVKKGVRIGQIPVCLKKCEYERASKLRTFQDGFRHMKYILKNQEGL